jgi:hypothetical protein
MLFQILSKKLVRSLRSNLEERSLASSLLPMVGKHFITAQTKLVKKSLKNLGAPPKQFEKIEKIFM